MHQNQHQLFSEIARQLEAVFHKLEAKVSPPEFVRQGDDFVFRYTDQSIKAAIIQKCARMISGLNACLVLLESGFVQELGSIFRMLDEFNEDIAFLCEAIRTGEVTELHQKYLEYFYLEEFDNPESSFLSTQKRPPVPRKKIHAAIARIECQEVNPSDLQELHRTISSTYSGFVHAASTHCMDMYGGNPPKFHVSGMLHTPRHDEFYENAWHYFYRGLLTMMLIALSFEEEEILKDLYQFRAYVEKSAGKTEWEDPETMLKREKQKGA